MTAKRDFHLAPPASITVELFDRDRDTNGNPTAHYLLMWSNGQTGADYQGGSFRTSRRESVGYGDKASEGAIGLAQTHFPGTCWKLTPGSTETSATGATFTLERDHENERTTVIFRADKDTGETVAFFPLEAWDTTGAQVAIFTENEAHGGAIKLYYADETRPAKPEAVARLRKVLEGRGYKLTAHKRWTPAMDDKRAALLSAQRETPKSEDS